MITYYYRWILAAILGMALLSNGVYAAEKINPRTLCPMSGSTQQTILLIDTTDPLTLVARARLKQLLQGVLDAENQHYLQPAHELIVYHLTPLVADMRKPMRVCNPGNPKDRTWEDDLKCGVIGAKLRWRAFEKRVVRIWQTLSGNEKQTGKYSPLLESISLVTARHIPIGVSQQRKPTRLILFSDMLQNSRWLSHYKSLPDMKSFKALIGYAEMESDLHGVDVWLFYIRRTHLEHKQTPKHYYWWTQAVELFNGRLIEQMPL